MQWSSGIMNYENHNHLGKLQLQEASEPFVAVENIL